MNELQGDKEIMDWKVFGRNSRGLILWCCLGIRLEQGLANFSAGVPPYVI
jgi:hypothetical protein